MEKKRRGRPKLEKEEEKKERLPLHAKKKNHEAIVAKVAPIIKRMDK